MKFSQEEVAAIVEDYTVNHLTIKELSKKYNRNDSCIIRWLKKKNVHKYTTYRYTKDDIEYLRKYYPIGGYEAVKDRFPSTTKASVVGVCSQYKIKSNYILTSRWTKEEVEILRNNYPQCSIGELYELLGRKRTKASIETKIGKLKIPRSREYWSEEEEQIIIDNYSIMSVDDVMKLLPKRTRGSIIAKVKYLGVQAQRTTEQWWTKEQIDFLTENYLKLNDEQLAKKFGRSKRSVMDKRWYMGLIRYGHYDKASYSDLSKFIRGNIGEWKSSSVKNCDYKCVLTGSKEFDIHHLYSFSRILNETIEEYEFEIKDNFSDYTEDELKFILEKFKINQDKYPLGICLRKDIHKLFHAEYGLIATEEMWDEFEERFKSGEYTINQ